MKPIDASLTTKYLGCLTAMNRVKTFDAQKLVANLKLNAAVCSILIQMGWVEKTKEKAMYKYTGPTPSVEVTNQLILKMREYTRLSHEKNKNKNATVIAEKMVKEHTETTIQNDSIIEQAALLAEVAVRLGKKDLAGFIKSGLSSK